MNNEILIPLIATLVGGFVGYLINHYLAKKREIELVLNKEKRVHYQLFINLFIDILSQIKLGKKMKENELMERFYEFQKKHLLYSSPKVINSFSDFWIGLQNNDNKKKSDVDILTGMTNFILTMRKDLGLENKALGERGERLLKGMLTDYDKHFD